MLIILGVFATNAAQESGPPGGALRPGIADLPTPLNLPPDANRQMLLHQRRSNDLRFETLNALRHRQMVEETAKILILARDMQAKLAAGVGQPASARMVREAEVIEILAHDVHARMTMIVGDCGNTGR